MKGEISLFVNLCVLSDCSFGITIYFVVFKIERKLSLTPLRLKMRSDSKYSPKLRYKVLKMHRTNLPRQMLQKSALNRVIRSIEFEITAIFLYTKRSR